MSGAARWPTPQKARTLQKKTDAFADMVLSGGRGHRRRSEQCMSERLGDDHLNELLGENADVMAAQRAARREAADGGTDRVLAVGGPGAGLRNVFAEASRLPELCEQD